MSAVNRYEIIRWFVTPNELRGIADRMEVRWNDVLGGENLMIRCISGDDSKTLLEIIIDQSAMPPRKAD